MIVSSTIITCKRGNKIVDSVPKSAPEKRLLKTMRSEVVVKTYPREMIIYRINSYLVYLTKYMDYVILQKIAFVVLVIYSLYWYFAPKNIIKELDAVGYDHLYENIRRSRKLTRKSRTFVVIENRRKRIVGNLPPVFPNGWFSLMDSNELPTNGIKHIAALGEQLAVFRGESGEVRILSALCPHLGANIAVGGVVNGNCIQCPFHGWQFNGEDGKCVSIPYSDTIPVGAEVKRWYSCEVNSFIFVWYHAENEEPSWYPQIIPDVHYRRWWYRGRKEHYVNAHIQELPENGADLTHLPILHGPSILAGNNPSVMRKKKWSFVRHEWKASWAPRNKLEERHIGSMQLHTTTTIFDKFSIFNMDVQSDQIGPAYVVMNLKTFIGPIIILQTVTPVEPLLQKVVHKIFCPLSASIYGTLLYFSESILFERDVVIWNHKKYEDKPLLTKEENTIIRHRRWFSQFYTKNSPEYEQTLLQW